MLEKSNLNGVVLCNAPVIWPPPPPLPGMVMVGTFTQCECESQWSSQTLGQKYWVNSSPPLGTLLYKPKSSVCRLWQPILNLLARPWRAIPNEANTAVSYANNLCQMFKLPSGVKMRPLTNQMWIPHSYLTCWAKKWKWAFTPPPRETQTGEYEVIIPTFPLL